MVPPAAAGGCAGEVVVEEAKWPGDVTVLSCGCGCCCRACGGGCGCCCCGGGGCWEGCLLCATCPCEESPEIMPVLFVVLCACRV